MNQSIVHVALVVRDYDEAIRFYTETLNFTLLEDTYQPEQDKRWVLVRPPGSDGPALLLARASTPEQERFIGNQTGGRVFLFLDTDDFWRDYNRMVSLGITFVRPPKVESYGTVAVFKDLYGNLWDLVQRSSSTEPARSNIELARRYLAAIEGGATGAELAAFFAPDMEQIEYPNRLMPAGERRDLAALLDGAVKGQAILRAQRYDVERAYADGDVVVLEVVWVGTLSVPIGTVPAGGDMRAHFAVVLEIVDGRIRRQRNYDCFDAF